MAKAAECSKLPIINIGNNLRRFGNIRAPLIRVGRRRSINSLDAINGLGLDEQVSLPYERHYCR
jgi:hypothetical protein